MRVRRGHRLLAAGFGGLSLGAAAISAAHWTNGPSSSREANFLRAIPLNLVGISAHYIGSIPIPKPLRGVFFKSYCSGVGCDPAEVEGNLDDFRSLTAFFGRKLRSEVRPIDKNASLIVPCDGTIIAAGPVGAYGSITVKDVSYRIRDLLGAGEREPLAETSVAVADRKESGARLWYTVIHIAPGQCHRFSSPASWELEERRRIEGYVLWLNPNIEGLYTQNERVAMLGSWEHGLFTMTAVGAAGRGSILLDNEDRHFRPQFRPSVGKVAKLRFREPQKLSVGNDIGGFLLGSAVVLVFEAPEESFVFHFSEGDNVKLGQRLATARAVVGGQKKASTPQKKPFPVAKDSSARARFRRAW